MPPLSVIDAIARRRPAAVLIAGPTASGKSALAIDIALATGGAVVNADSMQVYRDLSLITARPPADDEARVPHRMYGMIDAADAYSTGRWLATVAETLNELRSIGCLPVITGGTGLYFKALAEGLSPIPPIPDAVRQYWRREAARVPPGDLHAMLAARDATGAARLSPADPQRITRALEVLDATGRPLHQWQQQPGRPLINLPACQLIVLAPPRDTVLASVNGRFDGMMAAGALDEVAALVRRGLSTELPAMRATGVPELAAHLAGACDRETAIEAAKAATRRYVKRQLTWLRKGMATWDWLDG